jgi:hypothetical protein
MITITTNSTDHKLRHTWQDLTLLHGMKLRDIKLPQIGDDFDWFQHQDVMKQAMSVLCDTVNWVHVDPLTLQTMYMRYALPLIYDLQSEMPQTYMPQLIESFKHNGVTYLMPESLVIDELTVLQHKQDTKRFIEASNLMKSYSELAKDGLKAMSMFTACVVKVDRSEPFDEATILQRAKEFGTLTMDVVWEIFFCISLHTAKSLSDILRSTHTLSRAINDLNTRERLVLKLGRLRSQRRESWEELKRLTGLRFGERSKYSNI